MTGLIEQVAEQSQLVLKGYSKVGGGDINATYQVVTEKATYFLKVNSNKKYPAMFLKETEGLDALRNACALKVPVVIGNGVINDNQFLLMEWLKQVSEKGDLWEQFAKGLAMLHKTTSDTYGWPSVNYIGSLLQSNTPTESWSSFYANERILPLATTLFNNRSFSTNEIKAAEALCVRFEEIFPDEPPALLHGDLWAGNFMSVESTPGSTGIPAIYDPAVYFGHREMDIGMTLLFGGFEGAFYEAYNSFYPLEKSWRQRVPLTQLYPLLVHAILFGGRYVGQCKEILKNY